MKDHQLPQGRCFGNIQEQSEDYVEVQIIDKVTFSISDEKQLNPTVYQSVSIKRKRLMSHYSDRSAFSDINRIIEKHVFSLMRGEFLKTHITRKSHDCIYNRDFHGK